MDPSKKDSKSKNTKHSTEAVSAGSELGMNYISHVDGTRFNHIITVLEQNNDINKESKLKRQLISCFIEILYKNVMPYLYKNTDELKDQEQIILNILNYINKQLINTKEKSNFINKNKYPYLIAALIDVILNYESKVSSEYMIASVLQREAFLSLEKELTDKAQMLTTLNEQVITDCINILENIQKLNQNPEYPHFAYIDEFYKNHISKLKNHDYLHSLSSKAKMVPPQPIISQKSVANRQAQQRIMTRRLPVNRSSIDDNMHITTIKGNIAELESNLKGLNGAKDSIKLIHEKLTMIYSNSFYKSQFYILKDTIEAMQKKPYFYTSLTKCLEEYNNNNNDINTFLECFLYFIELVDNFTKLEQYIKESISYASEIDQISYYLLKLNSKYPNAISMHISVNEKLQSLIKSNASTQSMNVYNQQKPASSGVTDAEIIESIIGLQQIIDSFSRSIPADVEKIRPNIAEAIKQMQIVVDKSSMNYEDKKTYLAILHELEDRVDNYNLNNEKHNLKPLDEDDFVGYQNKEELVGSNNIEDLLAQAEMLANELNQTTNQEDKKRISENLENLQTQIFFLLNTETAQTSLTEKTSHKRKNTFSKIDNIEIIYDRENISRSPSPLILTQFKQNQSNDLNNNTISGESPKKKRMR